MEEKNQIKLFEDEKIRTAWNDEEEKWYFSIIDVIQVLTESERPRKYWSDLKAKLGEEGGQLSEKIGQLKMKAPDGKMRETDVIDTENLLRLIQSVPSPKAEPFKLWLAKVGNDRLEEIADPEKSINRAIETYRRKGYLEGWINQRIKSIEIRKDLTDQWDSHEVKRGREYAILTDEISKAWSEKTTKEIIKAKDPMGLEENKVVAKEGGSVAGHARKEIEEKTGTKVVTSKNAKELLKLKQKSS